MRRWAVILTMLCLICSLYFFNVWQSYRYTTVERQTERLEKKQIDLFEQNKRLIAGIALLESPDRVRRLATGQLGLSGPYEQAPLLIRLPQRSQQGEAQAELKGEEAESLGRANGDERNE